MKKNLWMFRFLSTSHRVTGTESLHEEIDSCWSNPKNSSTMTVRKILPAVIHYLFNVNKPDYYKGKQCMKNFCKDLKNPVTKITNFKRLKILPLTEKDNKSYYKQKHCYICKNKFNSDI